MKTPEKFQPISDSFTEDGSKEYLVWVPTDTDKIIYPEFFRTELLHPTEGVKHYVTDDRLTR